MIGYVYKTTNQKTGKIYIGQHLAAQFEPDKYIGSGCLFKKIVMRDGIEHFSCELLQECFSKEELNAAEQYYIQLYRAQDRNIGYNIADGGEEPWNRSKKMSEQYCKRASIAQRNSAPKVAMYELATGKYLQTFNSAYDAGEYILANQKLVTKLKTISSRINAVCRQNKGHAYGYIWRFFQNEVNLSLQELQIEHIVPRAKRIQQFTINQVFIAEYDSAAMYSKLQTSDRAEQRKIARDINSCCEGRQKTYRGFIWKYCETT